MMVHHIVTISLIVFSYNMNFTRIGNAVMCVMDFTDILLPVSLLVTVLSARRPPLIVFCCRSLSQAAKMLKYLGHQFLCDILFGIFLISWIITRHYFYGLIIYSALTEPQQFIELKWAPHEGHYLSKEVQQFFLALLLALQAVIVFWFILICQVAFRCLLVLMRTTTEATRNRKCLKTHIRVNCDFILDCANFPLGLSAMTKTLTSAMTCLANTRAIIAAMASCTLPPKL